MTVFPVMRRKKGGALNLDLCTNTFPVAGSYVCDPFSQVCFLSNTLPLTEGHSIASTENVHKVAYLHKVQGLA